MTRTFFITIAFSLLVLAAGCQKTMTYQQWCEKFKPDTEEQATAMAVLQTKLNDSERMSRWKSIYVIGMVASVIAIFAPLGYVWIKGVAMACFAGCFYGVGFLQANMLYPKIATAISAIIGIGVCILVIYAFWETLKKSVDKLPQTVVDDLDKENHFASGIIKKIWDKLP
jgi:hypothetical protein